jgi:serine/threonine protein phosphatase PrpC
MRVQALGPVQVHGLWFDVAAASEQGPRKENQDAFSVDAFAAAGLLAVADGMGGERAGRVAADTALEALRRAAPIASVDAARYAVRAADEAVARGAREAPEEREGMGCALALLSLASDRAGGVGWVGAHVGDVRIVSRAPDGTVRLETRDHTPAFARWEAGEIALDEIPDTPGANRLQRAVGRGGEADASWIPLRAGWSYLLLSDGITKAMRLDELGQALAEPDAATACRAILRKVEERGPDDNFTAVAVRVSDRPDASVTQPQPRPAAPASPPPSPAARTGGDAGGRDPLFNPRTPVTQPRRSPLPAIALLLSALALAAAGYAAYLARQSAAGSGAEAARLTRTVDSLRAELRALRPDSAPADTAAPGDTLRATAPAPAPTVPAGGPR